MSKIKVSTKRVSNLTPKQIEEMWSLYKMGYKHINKEIFLEDLNNKNYVFLGIDKETGEVGGFSTTSFFSTKLNNKKYNISFSGDTIFHPKYWGSKALNKTVMLFFLRKKIFSPLTPLIWNLVASGNKTFLILTKNCPGYYPHYRNKTPEDMEALRHHIGQLQFPDHYNKETGVIEFTEATAVFNQELAPFCKDTLEIPSIKHFVKMNPGYATGNELNIIAPLSFKNLVLIIFRTMAKIVNKQRKIKPWINSLRTKY